jgi:hypothetical protein
MLAMRSQIAIALCCLIIYKNMYWASISIYMDEKRRVMYREDVFAPLRVFILLMFIE